MRAFVRMIVTHKFRAMGVNQGFQGLLHDEVGALLLLRFNLVCIVTLLMPPDIAGSLSAVGTSHEIDMQTHKIRCMA